MEDVGWILLQLVLIVTVLAGFLGWVVRGLACAALQEAGDRAVLITGADTGIGHKVALHLDSLGFRVFAGVLSPSSEGAQCLRLEATNKLTILPMDVTNEEQVRSALVEIKSLLPVGQEGLYALINNAGICVCGEFDWQTWAQVESQISVNLLGSLRVTKLALPLLKKAKGRVVNVSSVAGLHGYPGLSVYCATKHALEGFTQVLGQELAKFGVRVISVQPGDFSKATRLLDNHHTNMNLMWGEMDQESREQYKHFFTAYHDRVARSGITGKRVKPVDELPPSLLRSFEEALLAQVPASSYLVLPSLRCRLRILLVGLLPSTWAHWILYSRYRKSLPPLSTVSSVAS